jgi:uncharacterized membrane protein (UPF0182 family)
VSANPWSRIARVAPFLRPAPTPRLVLGAGVALWVLDLEVEGEWYPLATPLPDRGTVVRYRRPAGVALIDAMTGAVRILPPADPDPLLRAWMALVPDVFAAGAAVGTGVDLAAVALTPGERTAVADSTDARRLPGEAAVPPIDDLRAEAATLYDAMEAARRSGDWAAYGAAWRQLGTLLGRPAP